MTNLVTIFYFCSTCQRLRISERDPSIVVNTKLKQLKNAYINNQILNLNYITNSNSCYICLRCTQLRVADLDLTGLCQWPFSVQVLAVEEVVPLSSGKNHWTCSRIPNPGAWNSTRQDDASMFAIKLCNSKITADITRTNLCRFCPSAMYMNTCNYIFIHSYVELGRQNGLSACGWFLLF